MLAKLPLSASLDWLMVFAVGAECCTVQYGFEVGASLEGKMTPWTTSSQVKVKCSMCASQCIFVLKLLHHAGRPVYVENGKVIDVKCKILWYNCRMSADMSHLHFSTHKFIVTFFWRQYVSLYASIAAIASLLLTSDRKISRLLRS